MRLPAFIVIATLGLAAFAASQPVAAQGTTEDCPRFELVGPDNPDAPHLILTPGLGSSPAVWEGVIESLARDYRVSLVHIAGFAGREPNGDPATVIERSAAEIIRHLDCERIESAAYAGHSLGGFLGLKLAIAHPKRIERLVVVDALPFYPLIFSPTATVESVAKQADAFRAQIAAQDDAAFEASQRMGVRALVRDSGYHDQVVGWSLASDRATFAAAIHALMTTDLRGSIGTIESPTTVIAAANPFAPRARIESLYGAAYAGLEGVEITVIDDSYHFIMFDQPEAIEAALRDALATGAPRTNTASD